jgi:hypothetical protein
MALNDSLLMQERAPGTPVSQVQDLTGGGQQNAPCHNRAQVLRACGIGEKTRGSVGTFLIPSECRDLDLDLGLRSLEQALAAMDSGDCLGTRLTLTPA